LGIGGSGCHHSDFIIIIIIASVLILGLIGYSQDAFASHLTPPTPATSINHDINMPAGSLNCDTLPVLCFDPLSTTVTQYDTVTWNNQDSVTHTATSGTPTSWTGVFNTGNVVAGGSSEAIQMNVVGTQDYHCQIHPWQTGTVTVTPFTEPVEIPIGADDLACSTETNHCFNPESVTVNQGEIVRWTNVDTAPEGHTVTSDDGVSFDSGLGTPLFNGMSFVVDTSTLQPGTYGYHCQIHPWATGSLTVDAVPSHHSIEIPDASPQGFPNPCDTTLNLCYNPDDLTVTRGDIVTWTNADDVTHTTNSDDGTSWISGNLFGTGFGVSPTGFILDTAPLAGGDYPYHCIIHPWQVGSLTVTTSLNSNPIPAPIQTGSIVVDLQTFVTDLVSPVRLTHNGDGSGDVYIVDQPGVIYRATSAGTLQPTPFLDISSEVHMPGFFGSQDENDFDERGLLGLAFHPNYNGQNPAAAGIGILYTFHSAAYPGPFIADFPIPMTGTPDNIGVVTEWQVDFESLMVSNPVVNPFSKRVIMTVEEPQFNHAGGVMEFNPADGRLYISFGDGGSANDNDDGHTPVTGNSQDESNILGSIIRIDPLCEGAGALSTNGQYCIPPGNPNVGVTGELDEIYAHGLRNTWLFSFDPLTGLMWGADVGQNQIEEINLIVADENYGWNDREGTFGFDETTALIDNSPTPPGMTDPVAQYDHDEGISVIGGYVYRGTAIPELDGQYVFGDFSTGFFVPDGRLFYLPTTPITEILELQLSSGNPPLGLFLKSFGQDSNGELYVLAGSNLGPFLTSGGQALGQVLKIIPDTSPGFCGDAICDADIGETIDTCPQDCEGEGGFCGDGVLNGVEVCEGTDLGGTQCVDISGFTGGTLACDASCGFDTSACTTTDTGQTTGSVAILTTCGLQFVSGAPINYGGLIPGAESLEQQLELDNTGNTALTTLFVRGTNWVDTGGLTIMDVSDSRFSTSSIPYGSKTALGLADQIITSAFDPVLNLITYWQLTANLLVSSFAGDLTQTLDFTVSC